MTESKKDNSAPKNDNSLLVALTVTSIGAAAVIGYIAGQVKMADTAYKQIKMLVLSSEAEKENSAVDTKVISTEAYNNIAKVCEAIMSQTDLAADSKTKSESNTGPAE